MIVNVTELGRGDILEIDGDPWQATEVQSQTPSARGASLLIKAKVKNLRTGQTLAKTWRGGETVTTAEVDYRQAQYLYRQGDDFVFMDLASYEQTTLDVAKVGDAAGYLLENLEVRTVLFQDRVIALNLPLSVDLLVEDTMPAIKGATAQAQLKPAKVETGITVMVPAYVESRGEDPRRHARRAVRGAGEIVSLGTPVWRVPRESGPVLCLVPGKPRGRPAFAGALPTGRTETETNQIPSARARPARRGWTHIFAMIASPNSLHLTSFAPSIRRAKS